MPDDPKPFHLSLDTPTTPSGDSAGSPQASSGQVPSGDAPQAPQPVVQDTAPPNSTNSQPSPQGATAGTAPQANIVTPAPVAIPPVIPNAVKDLPPPGQAISERSFVAPAPQDDKKVAIHPPIMPAQGGAPRTPRAVALPMAPHVVIHTMESDIQEAKKTPVQLSQQSPPPSISGDLTPKQPPNVPSTSSGQINIKEVKPSSKPKLLVGVILVLVVLGTAGYFGYDTIAPIFMSKATLPIPESSKQEEVAPLAQEETPPTPPAQQISHTSFLIKPADKTISLNLEALTSENIRAIFTSLIKEQVGTLAEMVPSLNNTGIALKNFGALFLVSFPFDLFEDDFTLLAYHDAKGVWPVVILKLKPGTENQNIALTKADIKRIVEQDSQTSITQLFAEDPGTPTSNFIDGGVANSAAEIRYRTFENNAVLDYGWLGDKLILTTSYAALKEAVKRLQ